MIGDAYHATHAEEWRDDCPQCDDAWPEEGAGDLSAAVGALLVAAAFALGVLVGRMLP